MFLVILTTLVMVRRSACPSRNDSCCRL